MAYFHGLCNRNCGLRYARRILELTKLNFRGLKCQFSVKKANFGGLIAKIGHYRPILASKTPPVIHFHGICHGEFDPRYIGKFLEFKKLDFRGLRGQFDVKRPILGDL